MLSCYNVIMLSCYNVIMLSCFHVIMLSCYHVIMLSCYHVIMLTCYAEAGTTNMKHSWSSRGCIVLQGCSGRHRSLPQWMMRARVRCELFSLETMRRRSVTQILGSAVDCHQRCSASCPSGLGSTSHCMGEAVDTAMHVCAYVYIYIERERERERF